MELKHEVDEQQYTEVELAHHYGIFRIQGKNFDDVYTPYKEVNLLLDVYESCITTEKEPANMMEIIHRFNRVYCGAYKYYIMKKQLNLHDALQLDDGRIVSFTINIMDRYYKGEKTETYNELYLKLKELHDEHMVNVEPWDIESIEKLE